MENEQTFSPYSLNFQYQIEFVYFLKINVISVGMGSPSKDIDVMLTSCIIM